MAVDLTVNWFGLEGVLIGRLRSELPELAVVGGAWDYDRDMHPAHTEPLRMPAAYVLFDNFVFDTAHDRATRRMVEQSWDVLLLCRPAPPTPPDTDSLKEAGSLVAKVMAALEGWPSSAAEMASVGLAQPITATDTEEQMTFYLDGAVLFRLTFTARLPLPRPAAYQ